MATPSFPRLRLIAIAAVFSTAVFAQTTKEKKLEERPDAQKVAQQKQDTGKPEVIEEPPEEDASAVPKTYVLNPLQAEKEYKIGLYYFKKGSFKAASRRFEEATKWNPGFAEAFEKLGDSYHKLKDDKAAKEAYQKCLDLAPEGKESASVKKKLGKG